MGIDLIASGLLIYVLFGAMFVGLVLFLVLVFSTAYIRGWIWDRGVKRAEEEDYRSKHREDGSAYPPTGRGMCDNCQGCFEKVYYLSSGTRLCDECFKDFEES